MTLARLSANSEILARMSQCLGQIRKRQQRGSTHAQWRVAIAACFTKIQVTNTKSCPTLARYPKAKLCFFYKTLQLPFKQLSTMITLTLSHSKRKNIKCKQNMLYPRSTSCNTCSCRKMPAYHSTVHIVP
ncbi:unnamed protein product [Ixodes persulcatus]